MLSKISLLCLGLVCTSMGVTAELAQTPFELSTIAEGVYVHHGQHLDIDDGYQGDICNLSVVIGNTGVAVIDTGGSKRTGMQLLAAIRRLTALPVRYVINTHVHPDHTYGNAAFVGEHPEFIGHDKLAKQMLTRQAQYEKLNQRLLGADGTDSLTIVPTQAVQTQLTLDLGGRTLTVQAHPMAHTQTDISVVDDKTNTLFAGDLIFAERTPVIESDLNGLITVLERLNQQQFSQIVPGHGKESRDQASIIGNALRYDRALLADVRQSIKKGISMENTMETAAQSERERWLLFDIANRRNVNTVYPQLEWE